jgi:Arc/MetJ family transcription regulator
VEKQVVIDEELLERAERLTGVKEPEALIREALTALIERESTRRLARLGGSEPDMCDVPRRRTDAA